MEGGLGTYLDINSVSITEPRSSLAQSIVSAQLKDVIVLNAIFCEEWSCNAAVEPRAQSACFKLCITANRPT